MVVVFMSCPAVEKGGNARERRVYEAAAEGIY